jgi:hypothetical protein
MKKAKTTVREPEMRAEYDFSGGVRGKYAARYAEGTEVAIVDRRARPKARAATAKKTRPA